ncbi:glycosyltransferase, partial [Devosia sp.]|uniref:glycosyltransferase n=1 Tax=Devosia sp. TaxID=1871048 RepID=UPI00262E6D26
MRISACLIVKNEQPFLDGCLLSLGGLVDEIVVVDTGSTDTSIGIARRHGARVIEWAWRSDFAAARNVGL